MAGALCTLLLSIVSAVSTLFSLSSTYVIAIVGMIACGVWATQGSRYAHHFIPVLIFALFGLVSLPDEVRLSISAPLQLISTKAVLAIWPHLITVGNTVHQFVIRGTVYDVAPDCSGLNQWLAFTYAFLIWQMFRPFSRRAWLSVVAAIPLITLALNMARLSITALLAFYVSKDVALSIHSNIDYFLFPLGLGIIWASARLCHAKS